MIGKLTGRLDYAVGDHVLIETGGVGYVVHCSERTLARLPGVGEIVSLYIEHVVREDAQQLYGFLTLAEKEWHRLLTSVQGIGAKGALAILGTLGAEGVGRAISLGDVAAVKAAPGVGPKTAQRVVLELKDKAPALMAMGAVGAAPAMATATAAPDDMPVVEPVGSGAQAAASAQADALSALVNLGYGQGDAAAAVAAARAEGVETAEALIRASLKRLAPGG